MGQIVLKLTYGSIVINNLVSTWIQPMMTDTKFLLCYADDKFQRNIIYNSTSKDFLTKIQDKLMQEIADGKTYIKLP